MARTVTRSFSAVTSRPSPQAAPVPPAIATSRPTPEFRRHHDVTAPQVDTSAFRQGWRVATRLDSLLETGRIDRECWDAAQQWRRWAEVITPCKTQAWSVHVDRSLVPNDAAVLHKVAAAAKLRAVAQALGPLRTKILESVVVKDLPWLELARTMRVSDKTAVAHAIEALEALGDWYGGRTVAAPPVLRYRNQPSSG